MVSLTFYLKKHKVTLSWNWRFGPLTNPAFSYSRGHYSRFSIDYDIEEKLSYNDSVPDGIEDFSVRATFKVIARLLIKNDEIRELSFDGEVFFCPDEYHNCYVIRFTRPGGIKVEGLEMKRCMGGPHSFGHTLSLAVRMLGNQVDEYMERNAIKFGAKIVR